MNSAIQVGTVLASRYRLEDQVGAGGMAIVYRAIDMNTWHWVAVKVLKPEYSQDAEFVGRFQREAEAASKMTHTNIVNLLDVGMEGNDRYLIMEYVQGQTLKDVILEKGRLSVQSAVQITIRILSALQHAHQNGIIHRDIKPQNILMQEDGHVKVADFGIARIANRSTLTKGDSVMGSVHYFSPEQASGKPITAASDLYSVGVTLYEMLTGHVPFDGENQVAIAMQHLNAIPVPIQQFAPDVPDAVCHVCMKAMEKNPAYRYQTAREMATDLRYALTGQVQQLQPRILDQAPETPPAAPPASLQHSNPHKRVSTERRFRRRINWKFCISTAIMSVVVLYGIYLGCMAIYERVVNTATVDDYVGMNIANAQKMLERAGLRSEVVQIHHATVSAGNVVLQSPQEGVTLHKGDAVVLNVSKGPATQQVPRILDMTVEDAQKTLQPFNLSLAVVNYEISPTTKAGVIIAQTPEAGSACQPGDFISVTVSGGVAYVPRAVGHSLLEAQDLIKAAGLNVSPAITYIETADESQHAQVAAQSPEADLQVVQGTHVSLTVYRMAEKMARERVILSLPETSGLMSVQVTLMVGDMEITVYEGDYPANASRQPEVELITDLPGTYTYRVYFNHEFAYQQQVTME